MTPNRQRIALLGLTAVLLCAVSAWIVYRGIQLRRNTFAAGAPPQDVLNIIAPQKKELSEMRPPAVLPTDEIRFGSATSLASVIEFGDYECQDCRAFANTVNEVLPRFNGKVRFVWRDLPIEDVHEKAFDAAVFARCAAAQGQYWRVHDALLAQPRISEGGFGLISQSYGLNLAAINACRNDQATIAAMRHEIDVAKGEGVLGVPLIFVGTKAFYGPLSAEDLDREIRQFLSI